jgi:hypothetical protein
VRVLVDPDLRQRLGQAAREDVQRFSVAQHADALVRLYTDLALARDAHLHGKASVVRAPAQVVRAAWAPRRRE